jgi:pantoate--beta-alanine ligase
MIELIDTASDARVRVAELRRQGQTIGFVPTMGALHAGHLSLIERADRENDRVVVSIFVNPTQYDDPEDLERYPRTLAADTARAEAAGADFIFHPAFNDLYHDGYRFRISETEFSRELEGAHRPGHFDGVLTIVLKLLNIVQADRAYFGDKDWQQQQLVRDMARAFFHRTEIIGCPVIREPDGLAMSSRNVHLTTPDRARAPEFHRILSSGASIEEMRRQLADLGFGVDYVERRDDRILGAVRLGKVRLIDNVEI